MCVFLGFVVRFRIYSRTSIFDALSREAIAHIISGKDQLLTKIDSVKVEVRKRQRFGPNVMKISHWKLPESAGLALPRFLVLTGFDLQNRFASSMLTGGHKGSGIVHVNPALQPAWTFGNTTKIDPPALFFRSSCLGRWPTSLQEKESRPHVELLKIIGDWGGDWRGGDGCLDMLIQYVNTCAA